MLRYGSALVRRTTRFDSAIRLVAKRYVKFNVFVVCEADEVDEVLDRLADGVDNLCSGEGPDHECDYEWTAGGCTMTEEQYEEEERLEDILADLRKRERTKKEPRKLKVRA